MSTTFYSEAEITMSDADTTQTPSRSPSPVDTHREGYINGPTPSSTLSPQVFDAFDAARQQEEPYGGDMYKRDDVATVDHWPGDFWYHDNTFYLPFPWYSPFHHDRKPTWWMSSVSLPVDLSHILLALQCADDPEGNNKTFAENMDNFVKFAAPYPPVGPPNARQQQVRKAFEKTRKEHGKYGPVALALTTLANLLTSKASGGVAAPQGADVELVGNDIANLALEKPLRVS